MSAKAITNLVSMANEAGEVRERAAIVAWLLRWRFEDPVKTAIRDEFIRSIERGDHIADAIARRELGA